MPPHIKHKEHHAASMHKKLDTLEANHSQAWVPNSQRGAKPSSSVSVSHHANPGDTGDVDMIRKDGQSLLMAGLANTKKRLCNPRQWGKQAAQATQKFDSDEYLEKALVTGLGDSTLEYLEAMPTTEKVLRWNISNKNVGDIRHMHVLVDGSMEYGFITHGKLQKAFKQVDKALLFDIFETPSFQKIYTKYDTNMDGHLSHLESHLMKSHMDTGASKHMKERQMIYDAICRDIIRGQMMDDVEKHFQMVGELSKCQTQLTIGMQTNRLRVMHELDDLQKSLNNLARVL